MPGASDLTTPAMSDLERGELTTLHQLIGDPERARLLVVDDEESMRVAISRFLRTRGYLVQVAGSASEALDLLDSMRFAAMICDIRMPGMSGVELVPRALERDPELAVMMLTAVHDSSIAAQSLANGAGEYLIKPVELGELGIALERVLHQRNMAMERRNVERLISDEVDRRAGAIEHDRSELQLRAVESVALAVAVAESKDPYFAGTSTRVAALSRAIAEYLALPSDACDGVATAARVHDVGRLALREAVLHKPGPLTGDEYELVKDHVRTSLEVLSPLIFLGPVLEFVEDHHEHWDGTGYPRGRSANQISVGGRILGAADAFVAMTSRRPYRHPIPPDDTLLALQGDSERHLDPEVLHALGVVVTERRVLGLTAD